MKTCYICSKYAGEVKKNVDKAKEYAKFAHGKGYLPITVHLFLNDSTGYYNGEECKEDREILINWGIKYLEKCDELWIFETEEGISSGMKTEIIHALKDGMEIKRFKVKDDEKKRMSILQI